MAAVISALAGGDEAGIVEMSAVIVGDQVHAILKAHALKMPTVAAATALGVNVAAQMLVETVMFADSSVDGGDDGETLKRAATAYFSELFAQKLPGYLRSIGDA